MIFKFKWKRVSTSNWKSVNQWYINTYHDWIKVEKRIKQLKELGVTEIVWLIANLE